MFRLLSTLIYKFFGAGLSFFITVLTSWLFGDIVRGYLTYAINNFALYQPVIGSFSEYLPYGIHKRKQDVRDLFATALVFCLGLAALLLVIGLALAPWLLTTFAEQPETAYTFLFAALVAPFAMFHVYVTRLMWGLDNMKWLNRLNTVQLLAFIPLIVVVWLIVPDPAAGTLLLLAAWVVSYALTALISGYVARTEAGVGLLPRTATRSLRQDIWRYGTQLAGGRLLNQLNNRLDIILVFWGVGVANTAVYGLAVTVADMLFLVSNSILQVVMTRMTALDERGSAALTASTFRHTAVFLLLIGGAMSLVMPFVIELAFPPEFAAASSLLYLLLPGIVCTGLSVILQTYFTNQLGRPKVTMVLEAGSILVNLPVALLLMPSFGEAGTAIAKSSAFFAALLFTMIYFSAVTKYPFHKLLWLQPEDRAQYKAMLQKLMKKTNA